MDRELAKEKRHSQFGIIPFLIAEDERDQYRRNYASLQREAMIMKDVAGWEVSLCIRTSFRWKTELMSVRTTGRKDDEAVPYGSLYSTAHRDLGRGRSVARGLGWGSRRWPSSSLPHIL